MSENIVNSIKEILKEHYVGDKYYVNFQCSTIGHYGLEKEQAEKLCKNFNEQHPSDYPAHVFKCNDFATTMEANDLLDEIYEALGRDLNIIE